MLSFRKKIFFSDIALFLIFIALLFPFIGKTVDKIAKSSLSDTLDKLIEEIQQESSLERMIKKFQSKERLIFYHVSLLDNRGGVLYDSYGSEAIASEMKEALKDEEGYSERFSERFLQPFAFVAKSFDFHGQKFVIRAAFPLKQIAELKKELEIGFMIFGVLLLLLYSLMSLGIVHRFSRPIQQIIKAIRLYEEGKQETLPHLEINRSIAGTEDFKRLAKTLNSLSDRVRNQIETLIVQRNEKEAILESLVEGVLAFDDKGIVSYANQVAISILGNVIGKHLKNEPLLEKKCKELLGTTSIKKETVETNKMVFDIIAVPVINGTILILQDKTSDYKMLQMGKDFIANASHELRTPITVIRGYAETLHDMPKIGHDILKEITGKLLHTSERLNNLIESLLTLSDIENVNESHFVECELNSTIENCRQELLSMHRGVKVVLHKTIPLIIRADPELIELAIMNILENAVKYSEKEAEIGIALEKENSKAKISIRDKGIGIPKQDREHIFERFYTVDKAHSRKLGGAGLGLAIVKTVVEKHNGEVSLTSSDKGTCFYLKFPLV